MTTEEKILTSTAFCTLCKKIDEDLHPIDSISDVLENLMFIQIAANDNESKVACFPCIQKVVNWCDFKRYCQKINSKNPGLAKEHNDEKSLQVKGEKVEPNTSVGDDDSEKATENDSLKLEPIEYVAVNTVTENLPGDQDCLDEDPIQAQKLCTKEIITLENESRSSENKDSVKKQLSVGLKQITREASSIKNENLSAIEISYSEKCKAMANMYYSFKCACHLITYPNLKGLLSHLRSMKMWFPAFTCYHCMITSIDKSSSGKHIHRCTNKNLERLVELSNLNKRSPLKTRIYQNYRCVNCRFIYYFNADFCEHVDEEHSDVVLPYLCSCQQTFKSLEDYKDHIYVSCMVEYFCDICHIAVKTLKEFIKHSELQHDNSEGFTLLQDDHHKKRILHNLESDGSMVKTGKKKKVTVDRAQKTDQKTKKSKSKLKYPKNSSYISTPCPQCSKVYSSRANMFRHYFKNHTDTQPEEIHQDEKTDMPLYRCPDCQIMYSAADWEAHKQSHEKISCPECETLFQFQTELEEHRVIHLNLKVYRDSETHSYKSAKLSTDLKLPYCKICDMLCENFEDLKNHKLSHVDWEEEIVQTEALKYTCVTCTTDFSTYAEYSDHNANFHTDNQTTGEAYPKKCDECDRVITSGGAFAGHKAMHKRIKEATARVSSGLVSALDKPKSRRLANEEAEDYHTCKRCFKVFSTKSNLKKHLKIHGITNKTPKSPRKFLCDRCHLAFSNIKALNFHIDEEHEHEPSSSTLSGKNPRIFACDVCIDTFPTETALIQHEIRQHPKESRSLNNNKLQKYTAQVCSGKGDSSETSRANKNKQFICNLCDKSFSSESVMYAHADWHKRFNNEGFTEPSNEESVTPNKSKISLLKCHTCSKELPNDIALKIHNIEKHGNVASFLNPRCESCNEEFSSHTEYDTHMKLHEVVEMQKTMETVFTCQFCSLPFSKMETLQLHVKRSHTVISREYKCQHCGKCFENPILFDNHLKAHEKYKRLVANSKSLFHCSICYMGFSKSKDLRAHTMSAHPF